MSFLDNTIEQLGMLVTVKIVSESVNEQGYSVKSYTSSQAKCIINELTGLEPLWDIAGVGQPGDIQAYFKTSFKPKIGDLILYNDPDEYEIVQVWARKFMNKLICYEVVARKK